jgi:electron transfer flavoprotein alpha/beta subunit
MKIAAFLKYVLDPDILARDFSLDPKTALPTTTFPNYQFDAYDRIALEIALRSRDVLPDVKVSALCVGPEAAVDRLRETMALKADDATLLETSRLVTDHERARIFARWVEANDISAVVCGRMTSDTDSSAVGPIVAEVLGWRFFPGVVRIERREGRLVLKHEVADGYEWIAVDEPFVAAATSSTDNVPRKAKLQDVMRAQKATVVRIPASEYEDSSAGDDKLARVSAEIPTVVRVCDFIEADTASERAVALARRLLPFLKKTHRTAPEKVGEK